MKVGLFSDDFLPRKSGITSSMLALKAGLETLGHEVYVIAPKARGYADNDPHVMRLPSINPLIFDKSRLAVPLPRHIRPILDLDLDIVHSHTQFSMGVVADYVARKNGIPHVTTAHTIWTEFAKYYPLQVASSFGFLSVLYQLYFFQQMKVATPMATGVRSVGKLAQKQMWHLEAIFYNAVDLVTVPSEHFAQMLADHSIQQPVVIPNGVNVEFFSQPRTRKYQEGDSLRVVCVGRLSHEKRQNVLIEALRSAPQVQLSLIGDGPSMAEYKILARHLEVDDRVTFYGSRDPEFVRGILLDSDVFALASYQFDNHPIVLIEAAAAGLPITYCDPKLRISPEASCLIAQKPTDFARAFKSLRKHPAELKTKSRAAVKTAQTYDHITYAKAMLKEYKKLLKKN